MKTRLADLFTHSRELDDLILSCYPRKIFESQHEIDETENPKLYCFYDLDYNELRNFLEGRNYEYELRDSKTGDILKVNYAKRSNTRRAESLN